MANDFEYISKIVYHQLLNYLSDFLIRKVFQMIMTAAKLQWF